MTDLSSWLGANYLVLFVLTVIVGLFALVCWVTKYLIERDKVILAANAGNSGRIPFSAMFVMIILGGTVFVGLLGWIFQPSQESATNGFGTLAGLILLGMVVFIGIMNILTLSAARIGMLDGRQPFGLPEGSVRAILTIAFIVLVGVLSSFLLTGSNNRTGYSTKGVVLESLSSRDAADQRAAAIMLTYGANALVAVEQEQTMVGTPPQETTAFKIRIYPKVDYSVSDDISKQTLTMVSTILAAMIGFYFASRSDAGAADPANVTRTNALKTLRELLVSTHPEEAVIAAREKLEAYTLRAKEALRDSVTEWKAEEAVIKIWEANLTGYEAKLKAVKTVSDNDRAAHDTIMAAKTDIETINDELQQLQKDIADRQAALPTEPAGAPPVPTS